jgi:hypothetical protein
MNKYAQNGVKTQKIPKIHPSGAILSTKKVQKP